MQFTRKSLMTLIAFSISGIQACSSHQPSITNPKIINAADLISDLENGKNILIQDKTIDGDLDFSRLKNTVTEGKGLKRVYVEASITFINCVFTGSINAYKSEKDEIILCDFSRNITFTDCQIKKEFSLREAIIHGNASFNGTFFIGPASFEGTRFMGEAGFNKTNYAEELRFQNAWFYNKCNFMDAVFGKTTYFQACIFYGDAQLSTAHWMAYADFSLCQFNSGVFFNYAVFSDRSVFNNTTFRGRAEFFKTTFTGSGDFRNCQYFGSLKMNDAEVQQSMNLSGSIFLLGLPDTALIRKSGQAAIQMDQVKSTMVK